MDYSCAKFGDFSFSRFGFIVQTNKQTHRHRIRDGAAKRLTPTAVAGVSKKEKRRNIQKYNYTKY